MGGNFLGENFPGGSFPDTLYSMHRLLRHIPIFTIHESTHFSFLQITSSLLCNENNGINDA